MPRLRPIPDELSIEQKITLWNWIRAHYPHHFGSKPELQAFLRSETDRALDWARANGKRYADYPAFLRNWMRRSLQSRGVTPRDREPKSSKPSPRGRGYCEGRTARQMTFLRDELEKAVP